MAQTTIHRSISEEDEQFQVLHWRLSQLLEAGFDLDDATDVAFHLDVDLHQALKLRQDGCPSLTAARILL
jgi:hypothetical protein